MSNRFPFLFALPTSMEKMVIRNIPELDFQNEIENEDVSTVST